MIIDNVKMILKYWKLKDHLIKNLEYTEKEAMASIAELRKMDPEILHLFLKWFNTNELPASEINGVTIQNIINTTNCDIVSAFIDWDWVKKDPRKAKSLLRRPISNTTISDEEKNILEAIAKKKKMEFRRR